MDFDKYIQELLHGGKTLSDIADGFLTALNKAQAQEDLAKKQEREFERTKEAFIDTLTAALDTGTFDSKAVAAITVLARIESGEVKTKEAADKLYIEVFNWAEKPIGSTWSIDIAKITNDFNKAFDKGLKGLESKVKVYTGEEANKKFQEDLELLGDWLKRHGL